MLSKILQEGLKGVYSFAISTWAQKVSQLGIVEALASRKDGLQRKPLLQKALGQEFEQSHFVVH
jgi:hypothetical protein